MITLGFYLSAGASDVDTLNRGVTIETWDPPWVGVTLCPSVRSYVRPLPQDTPAPAILNIPPWADMRSHIQHLRG